MKQQENRSGTSETLAEKKRLLLEKRLNRTSATKEKPRVTLPKRPADSRPLASLGQQRIWLLDRISGNTPSFNVTSSFYIDSEINHAALEVALNKIIARHEVLRSYYTFENSELIQHTEPSLHLPVERIDCSKETSLEEAAHAFVGIPFELDRSPLLRIALFTESDKRHLLTLSIHDIVFDKWSIKLFWKEFSAFYEEEILGSPAIVPELAVQYSDFAHWQRKWLDDGEGKRQLEYWSEQLRNPPPPLPFATDHPYSNQIQDCGALERSTLSPATTGRLRELAAAQNASLFMLTLLGFNILLSKYTNTTDLLVSSPVANRRNRETADLLGFFLNTIVIRADLDGDPTVLEALDRIRKTSLEALTHQDLPPDVVVDEIKPERIPGRHPLFQTMFVFQREDEGKPKLHLHGCKITPTFIDTRTSKFDICLFVAESPEGMDTIAEYRNDIFEESTIKRLLGHYSRLMDDLVEHPEKRISELELLGLDELSQVISSSEGETLAPEKITDVTTEIRRHASTSPEAVAISGEGNTAITYAELENRVTLLAGKLVTVGAGKDVPIGIYMDQSPTAIVAILATLRAGSAYLPIDPSIPDSRTLAVLNDAKPAAMIADAKYTERLRNLTSIPLIDPDSFDAETGPSFPAPGDSDLAYLIYTSGSTGSPKGVKVTHRNLAASTAARLHHYSQKPGAFLLLSSLAFDSSVAGIFWTLVSGGTLVIPGPEAQRDPDLIRRTIERNQVTNLLCIPGLYREIIRSETQRLGSLHTAIVAGDTCPASLVREHHDKLPSCTLFNEYGPTEATVWCSVAELKPELPVGIGSTIPGCQTYVLSNHLDVLPFGIPGELCVAGPGVSTGYLNDEQKTREKFVNLTLPDGQRERIYRTGDLVRRLADGSLQFLGRLDHQIKVRGFRVELGEVESAIDLHQNIAESVVLAVQSKVDDQTETRLIGFLRLLNEESFDPKELKMELSKTLAQPAIPSQFVVLDHFPLLNNGKIDRKALPIPRPEELGESDLVHPQNPTETSLVEIWKEILALPQVSTTANFFDLGGSSLQAIRLISRIKESFGSRISTNRLLESPSVAQLARLIDDEDRDSTTSHLICMKKGTSELPVFLVPSGGLEILFYRPLAEHMHDSIPVYGIEPVGFKENETPLETVEEMAAHYLGEIESLYPHGPYRLLGHCFGATIALEMAKQSEARNIEIPLVIALDGQAPRSHHYAEPKGPGLWTKIKNPQLLLNDLRNRSGNPLRKIRENRIMKSGDIDQKTRVLIQRTGRVIKKAFADYKMSPYEHELLAFNCTESVNMPRHSEEAWKEGARKATVETISCLHIEILEEPFVREVADRINRELVHKMTPLVNPPADS